MADRHDLAYLNDGRYGNASSWMSDRPGRGWVAVEFAHEERIERVAWGRDRRGEFADRLAIDYVIEVADDGRGPAPGTAGSGVHGMRERARALGGELTAGPGPGGGFLVRARLPHGNGAA